MEARLSAALVQCGMLHQQIVDIKSYTFINHSYYFKHITRTHRSSLLLQRDLVQRQLTEITATLTVIRGLCSDYSTSNHDQPIQEPLFLENKSSFIAKVAFPLLYKQMQLNIKHYTPTNVRSVHQILLSLLQNKKNKD